ncbi:MAG: sigma-70 family RNA polymerase sigma factor [Planctomycetota bacterium]
MSHSEPIDPGHAAVEALLANSQWMQPLARRLLHDDAHLAADATQEAWVALLEKPPTRGQPVQPWLGRVVRYVAHHMRRSDRRRSDRERSRACEAYAPAAADVVARAELQGWLSACVMELDEPYRSTILHRFFDGLTTAEIARREGVSDAAVRMRVQRALSQLKHKIENDSQRDTQWSLAVLAAGAPQLSSRIPTVTLMGVVMSTKKIVVAATLLLLLAGGVWWSQQATTPPSEVATGPAASSADANNDETALSPGDERRAADQEAASSTAASDATDGAGKTGSAEDDGEVSGDPAAVADPNNGNGSLEVQVVSVDDTPLSARVEVTRDAIPIVNHGIATTDAAGVCSFAKLPAGSYIIEAFLGATWTQATVSFTEEAQAKTVTLRFPGTRVVYGRIHGRTGSMDVDVRSDRLALGEEELAVDLLWEEEGGDGSGRLSTVVDDTGQYRIEGVAPGSYLLRITSKFHVEELTVAADVDLQHDIALPDGEVFGTVMDASTGEPAQHVQVILGLRSSDKIDAELLRRAGLDVASDRLRPDEKTGYYRFSHLPTGDYAVLCNGSNHSPQRQSFTISAITPQSELNFSLELGTYINLAIQDQQGRDVEAPRCWLGGISWGFTGRVGGLSPGTHDVAGYAPGYELQLRSGVEFKPGEATAVTFQLAPAADTRLYFVDKNGDPVPDVRVAAPFGDHDVLKMCATMMRDPQTPSTRTREQGYVLLRGRAAGSCRIVGKKSGYAIFDREVVLDPAVSSQRLELQSADTTFEWRLRVTMVAPGSEAEALGIIAGDVLRTYNGQALSSNEGLRAAIQGAASRELERVEIGVESEHGLRTLMARVGTLGVRTDEFEVE